jgi:hypothetical protein
MLTRLRDDAEWAAWVVAGTVLVTVSAAKLAGFLVGAWWGLAVEALQMRNRCR